MFVAKIIDSLPHLFVFLAIPVKVPEVGVVDVDLVFPALSYLSPVNFAPVDQDDLASWVFLGQRIDCGDSHKVCAAQN